MATALDRLARKLPRPRHHNDLGSEVSGDAAAQLCRASTGRWLWPALRFLGSGLGLVIPATVRKLRPAPKASPAQGFERSRSCRDRYCLTDGTPKRCAGVLPFGQIPRLATNAYKPSTVTGQHGAMLRVPRVNTLEYGLGDVTRRLGRIRARWCGGCSHGRSGVLDELTTSPYPETPLLAAKLFQVCRRMWPLLCFSEYT
jgi:hypothetical protein